MNKIGSYLNFHAQALELRSRRNEILASNIANAATPSFKARDLDFDAEIKRHVGIGPYRQQMKSTFRQWFRQ
jgi:flagellar basal-body rod protein FlgB